MQKRFVIGIDPAKGFAVYDRKTKKLENLITTDFWGIIRNIDDYLSTGKLAHVYVEDPSQNKNIWIANKNSIRTDEARKMMKIARNVGENARSGLLIIQYCDINQIPNTPMKPTKNSMTKLNAEMFYRITGWKKRSSEHSRDAAMLCWKR